MFQSLEMVNFGDEYEVLVVSCACSDHNMHQFNTYDGSRARFLVAAHFNILSYMGAFYHFYTGFCNSLETLITLVDRSHHQEQNDIKQGQHHPKILEGRALQSAE